MTWTDPIVDEVRRAREAYSARFGHDLRAIFRDLKEQEQRSGRQIVSYAEEEDQQFDSKTPVAPTRSGGGVSVHETLRLG